MKHFVNSSLSLLLAITVAFFSACSKKDEKTNPAPTKNSSPNVASINVTKGAGSAKKSEAPRSKKVSGTKTVSAAGNKQVRSASTTKYTAKGNDRKAKISGSKKIGRQQAETVTAWYIESVNGEANTTYDYIYFFDIESSLYYEYDISADNWDFGFFYTDENLDYIIVDMAEDGTVKSENIWEVINITDDSFTIKRGGLSVVMKSIAIPGFEDDATYTKDEVKQLLGSNVWFMAYEYKNGVLDESSVSDDTITFTALGFSRDGMLIGEYKYSIKDGKEYGSTEVIEAWNIDASGNLVIGTGADALKLGIEYVDSKNGLIGFTYQEGKDSYEYGFMKQDLFIETLTAILGVYAAK